MARAFGVFEEGDLFIVVAKVELPVGHPGHVSIDVQAGGAASNPKAKDWVDSLQLAIELLLRFQLCGEVHPQLVEYVNFLHEGVHETLDSDIPVGLQDQINDIINRADE